MTANKWHLSPIFHLVEKIKMSGEIIAVLLFLQPHLSMNKNLQTSANT